jgi:signal transduction histidine kinase
MRLAELTETMLDVARMNALGSGLSLAYVDLDVVARAAVARATASSSHIGPVSLHVASPVVGFWDSHRCDQLFTHLLASVSSAREGPIEIDVKADSENARISVRDTKGRTGDILGPGITLWIVRRIAEALGGHVSFANAPGRATSLSVELPLRGPVDARERG